MFSQIDFFQFFFFSRVRVFNVIHFFFFFLKYYLLARTLLQFNGDALNQSRTDLGRDRKTKQKEKVKKKILNDRKTIQKENVYKLLNKQKEKL
jgi:hypothetical protein